MVRSPTCGCIEMGTLLAGPFCGQILGDMGAEVIKVEPPNQGDPMRVWGRQKQGEPSLWWPVVGPQQEGGDARPAPGRRPGAPEGAGAQGRLRAGELPARTPWRSGACGWEELSRDQSQADHDPGIGLRPDRPLRPAGRLRRHWRGHGRPALRRRRPVHAAFAHGHFSIGDSLAATFAQRSARCRPCTIGKRPAAARWSIPPSTKRCST